MNLSTFLQAFDRDRRLPYSNRLIIDSVDSTNSLGKRLLRSESSSSADALPWLLIALQQTEGRGRFDHRWASPVGGIYVSVVLRNIPVSDVHTLPLLVAVGLCRSLDRVLAEPALLKWPNDIMVRGKKIGGILVETVMRNPEFAQTIIGFGINHDTAPESARYRATCVRAECAGSSSQVSLTQMMIGSLTEEIGHRGDPDYAVENYRRHSMHRPGDKMTCRTPDGEISATFVGFDRKGFLKVRSQEGEKVFSAAQLNDHPGR